MTTFYDIIYKIKAALEADPRVNTVSYGTIDLQALGKHNNYSLSHFNITNTSFTSNMIEISINIWCMDILSIEKGVNFSDFERKDNTYDVLNTQYSILNRLFSMFERGEFVDDGFKLSGSPVSSPFMVRFNDHVAGWESDFTIQVPNNMSICDEGESTPLPPEQEFNTVIGGLGRSVTTKTGLAAMLGVSETIIDEFELSEFDVQCNFNSAYDIPVDCFRDNLDINSYFDYAGYVDDIGDHAFRNAIGFNDVSIESATSLGQFSFANTNLRRVSFPNATSIDTKCFDDCFLLEYADVRGCTPFVGASAVDNQVFFLARQGLEVIAHIDTATNNGGGPDGDLEYIVNTLGGSVTYV